MVNSYLEYVSKLKHDQPPDYDFCRKLFRDELKKLGIPTNGKLSFALEKSPNKNTKRGNKTPVKRNTNGAVSNKQGISDSEEDDIKESPEQKPKRNTKKLKETKASWRDCPTAVASNIVKAGEYVSASPKPAKRQRKL